MAIEDIVKTLESEGEKERERVIKAAKQEATRIIDLAKEDAERVKEKEMERVSLLLKGETARIFNEAELYRKEETIKAKEKIIDRVFENSALETNDLRKSDKYQSVFENLARESFGRIGQGDVVVSIDKRDERVAQKVLNKLGDKYKLLTDLDCLGGLVVKTANERVIYLNTIDTRMQKARQVIKSEITEALFGS
jgi:vacuolar-type H+-ATPase subunit E/Vma4